MSIRARLLAPAQPQVAVGSLRAFAAGTTGRAEPVHSDPGGLWRFEPDVGGCVVVPRSALRLDGQADAPAAPARPSDGRRWVPLEAVVNREPRLSAAAIRAWLAGLDR